jgi:hypothetical protein
MKQLQHSNKLYREKIAEEKRVAREAAEIAKQQEIADKAAARAA